MNQSVIIQKVAVVICTLLLCFGVMILVWDGLFILKFGIDYNDAALVTAGNEVVEYGSAEQPLYARIPLFAYSIPIWFTVGMLRLSTKQEELKTRA